MSFGHIPSWAGGRQESGLANVIYQLAKHGSEIQEVNVTLAATDCFVPLRKDAKLTIVGWTKNGLLGYIAKHPIRAVKCFFTLKDLKQRYPLNERFSGLYLKRIFMDKALRCTRPQVLHLHGTSAAWYLDLVPNDIKVAVTFHGMTGLDQNVAQHDVLYQMEHDVFHSSRVNEVFFICTQLVSSFRKAYGDNGKKNLVIFNSYDSTQFYLEKDDATTHQSDMDTRERNGVTTLCTVASLSDLKGQFRVLSGLAPVKDVHKFKYFCIGSDNNGYAEKLKSFAKEHDIEFDYKGKMPPEMIRRALYEADYMIMPSSSEGFGLTYLEAIACGVPVILPRNIPIAKEKELINEKNSILLDDSSSVSISRVLSHINQYHFERKEVASTMQGFSWDEIARQYINEFKKLI